MLAVVHHPLEACPTRSARAAKNVANSRATRLGCPDESAGPVRPPRKRSWRATYFVRKCEPVQRLLRPRFRRVAESRCAAPEYRASAPKILKKFHRAIHATPSRLTRKTVPTQSLLI